LEKEVQITEKGCLPALTLEFTPFLRAQSLLGLWRKML